MRNKIMSATVAATALAMATTFGTAASASADAAKTANYPVIKGVYATLKICEAYGDMYYGDQHPKWWCAWDSPGWALWHY